MKVARYKRELSTLLAYFALLVVVGVVAPAFFGGANLRDLALNNAPILIVATGMTLVILVGEIDISVGSQFAVCTVVAGLLAKTGIALPLLFIGVVLVGAAMGALNGALIGWLRLPSIIVTLAPGRCLARVTARMPLPAPTSAIAIGFAGGRVGLGAGGSASASDGSRSGGSLIRGCGLAMSKARTTRSSATPRSPRPPRTRSPW